MKTPTILKTIVFLCVFTTPTFSQTTTIPDQNFEQALIDLGHDDALDGSVLTANISNLTALSVNNKSISNLTGIEDFVSLKSFHCFENQLTSVDLSNNTALEHLFLQKNDLTAIDVSNNTALRQLELYTNNLEVIDVSKNTALTILYLHGNNLTAVNVKNGNNINLGTFTFNSNSNLECIQVDDANTINSAWDTTFTGYSEDCYSTFNIENRSRLSPFSVEVYPNPVSNMLYIEANNFIQIKELQIYNILGKVVQKENGVLNSISLKTLPKGIYLLKLVTNNGIRVKKIIKK
jgi:hypothetical protein